MRAGAAGFMPRADACLAVLPHRDRAALLAIAGGVMLLLAHVLGGSLNIVLLQQAKRVAETYALAAVPVEYAGFIPLTFAVLLALAGTGGVAVVFGGLFYHRGNLRTGSLLVAFGAGTGLLGLLLLLGVGAYTDQFQDVLAWAVGPPGVAVLLLVIARREARRARRAENAPSRPVQPG